MKLSNNELSIRFKEVLLQIFFYRYKISLNFSFVSISTNKTLKRLVQLIRGFCLDRSHCNQENFVNQMETRKFLHFFFIS